MTKQPPSAAQRQGLLHWRPSGHPTPVSFHDCQRRGAGRLAQATRPGHRGPARAYARDRIGNYRVCQGTGAWNGCGRRGQHRGWRRALLRSIVARLRARSQSQPGRGASHGGHAHNSSCAYEDSPPCEARFWLVWTWRRWWLLLQQHGGGHGGGLGCFWLRRREGFSRSRRTDPRRLHQERRATARNRERWRVVARCWDRLRQRKEDRISRLAHRNQHGRSGRRQHVRERS